MLALALVTITLARDASLSTQPPLPATSSQPSQTAASSSTPQPTSDTDFVGVVLARQSVDIAPEFEGKLAEVRVDLGDWVNQEQVVATLDDESIKQDLSAARASQLRLEVQRSRAELAEQDAITELGWITDLLNQKFGAATKYERSRAQLAVDLAAKDIRIAEAALTEQQVRIEQLKHRLADTQIRAPFAGSVAARYQDPGAIVGPGTPVVRLISSDDLWVRFAVPEDSLAGIRLGAPVCVRVEALGCQRDAEIKHIAPELDEASRCLVIEAKLQRSQTPESNLKAGMVARVTLNKDTTADADAPAGRLADP